MAEPLATAPSLVPPIRPRGRHRMRLLFILLGVLLIVELVHSARLLMQPLPKKATPRPLSLGRILLTTPNNPTHLGLGQSVSVEVRVSTGGHNIDGMDLSLGFDPRSLQATSSGVLEGNMFRQYPQVKVDNHSGSVSISGISSPQGSGFNGIGTFAIIRFKAMKLGATALKVNYSPNASNLTNLVESATAKNVLASGASLQLNVADRLNAPVTTPSCSPRVEQQCQDRAGHQGSYWCTPLTDSDACQLGCFQGALSNLGGCKAE